MLFLASSCNDDDPEPKGCILARTSDNVWDSFACYTEAQFKMAMSSPSAGKDIDPNWSSYTDYKWELCQTCK